MKHLIISLCLLTLFLKTSAQSAPSVTDTIVHGSVEKNFPGGQEAYNLHIQKVTHYPAVAVENHIQGSVYIKFTIEKDSTLSNGSVYSGVGSGMDEVAYSAIGTSGKWIPSQINGNGVRTKCIVPVHFYLIDERSQAVNGKVSDTSYFNFITKFDSYGISLSEIADYEGKSVKFTGKVYGTKPVSDSVFIMTCGEYNYPQKYVNVVLTGKDTRVDNPKADLSGYLIQGKGTVVNYKGTLMIFIDDKKQYMLMKGFRQ